LNTYQCYQILGLQEGSSIKEVKSAYRKLALKSHPDKDMSNRDGEEFKLVTEAYQILRTEYKRTIGTNSYKSNDQKDTTRKSNSNSRKYSWGAKDSDGTSNDDWEKYARYAESEYQDFWAYYEKSFWESYGRIKSQVRIESEPVQAEEDVPVSVNVDPGRCIACCSCETIAPSVFHVEKNVRVNPKSRVINERGAKSDKILDAAQTCPTKAISVVEKDSCRRLYPW
jgi:curved DNA-binding protein CbpA